MQTVRMLCSLTGMIGVQGLEQLGAQPECCMSAPLGALGGKALLVDLAARARQLPAELLHLALARASSTIMFTAFPTEVYKGQSRLLQSNDRYVAAAGLMRTG